MYNKNLFLVFALVIIVITSILYLSIYSSPSNNLQIKYDKCSGFSRFYSPEEVGFLLPPNIRLPEKLGNNTLLGVAFWKRMGDKSLFIYYATGNISSLGCRDYIGIKLTPFYIMKGKDAKGVSIMIVINLCKSSSEVDEIFENETAKHLKHGYKVTSIKGYTVVYRDGFFKDLGEYIEIDSPTHVAIKLDKAIVVIYSIYNYNTLKNYIQEIIK